MAHYFNPSTQWAEAGTSMWVYSFRGLCRESQNSLKKSYHCSGEMPDGWLFPNFVPTLVFPVSGWFQSLLVLVVLFESVLIFVFSHFFFCPFILCHLHLQTWVFSVSVPLALTFSHSLSLSCSLSLSHSCSYPLTLCLSESLSVSQSLTVSRCVCLSLGFCFCLWRYKIKTGLLDSLLGF